MNNNLARIDQFKGVLNSQTIRAQLKNSLKDKAGQFMSSMIDLYSGETVLQNCDPEKVALECVKAAALDLPLVKSLGYAYVGAVQKCADLYDRIQGPRTACAAHRAI